MKKCPCHSGKAYSECCEPFHKGQLAPNALLLMRSRYTAYALNLPDYIIQTALPLNPTALHEISQFSLQTQFIGLTIIDFQEKGNTATVTFKAHLKQNQQDASFTEKSHFLKHEGKWFYMTGEIESGG
jgi:SEC-C motif domain protein